MRASIVPFIAARYLAARRRERGLATSLLSIVGVTVGVMVLTVVLGVMNGFQLGFIEPIVELSSYHIQIRGPISGDERLPAETLSAIREVPSVTAVVPFSEQQVLVEGLFFRPLPCVVRGVPADLLSMDPGQARFLTLGRGSFSLEGEDSIVIGSELASLAGIRVGDAISLVGVGGSGVTPLARRRTLVVTGIFKCGYYEFDSGLAFISSRTASLMADSGGLPIDYGVKLKDRFRDQAALQEISGLIAGTGFNAVSWREYNKSFFDALFMEKLMMMVLVGLIFIVVGFNIYNSLRRTVFEKREEIAVLKAVGVSPRFIQYVFIFEGFLIGLAGTLGGMLLGLLLAANINGVFSLVEKAINSVIWLARALFLPFGGGGAGSFAIFSPMYFYLTEVTARVLLPEAFLVAFFAVLACVGAAWGASRTVTSFRPAEILRYE